MRNIPRTPKTGSGTSALGEEDYRSWKAGHVTLAELAARCGVSAVAVNKRFKKIAGQLHAAVPGAPSTAPSVGVASSAAWLAADPDKAPPPFSDEDARTLATSAAFSTLIHANHFLTTNRSVAPSILKASSAAIEAAVDLLVKLGAITLPEPESKPLPKLVVQVMTEEEEKKLRDGEKREEIADAA